MLEGAVLFGIYPKIIDIRIAKYTIGQKVNKIWDEKLHSEKGEKIYDEIDKVYRCENCFHKFIEINQKLRLGHEIIHRFRMVYPNSALLIFYGTKLKNPTFIFETGIQKIGECILDVQDHYPPEDRNFKVIMKFGGTFIEVKAIHEKSGKEVNAKLNFF